MRLFARLLGLGLAAALLFIAFGYWGATRAPVVVEQSRRLPGLPAGAALRVLLIADTHEGWPDMPPARLDSVVAQANSLRPDLILLAGDYQGGKLFDFRRTDGLERAIRPLAALRAPLGVYAVMGNHDSMRWTPRVFANQPGPRLLVNSHADIGPLVIAGANSVSHGTDVQGTLARIPPGKPILFLLHEGDYFLYEKAPDRPVLALSGHTHGGQIYLPVIGSVGELLLGPTACRRGACTINGWPIHVTSGVGTSWLPLRIGVPPEIVMLTLTG
jgi:predicted MPP superfamily phosphohydrolase